MQNFDEEIEKIGNSITIIFNREKMLAIFDKKLRLENGAKECIV